MIEPPKSAIARIFTIHGVIAGAGFLISERHLFTCAHVVAAALGIQADVAEAPKGVITLDFPFVAPNEKRQARVVEWNPLHDKVRPTGTQDVVVLELTESIPKTVQAAPLREPNNLAEHDWKAFGFPTGYDLGVSAQGILRGTRVGGWIQLDGSQDSPYFVARGFSGGPIWDKQQEAVVGMVASVEKSSAKRAAFMIPTTLLAQAWPALELKSKPISSRDPYVGLRTFQEEDAEWFFGRRGLTKLLLEKIEQASFLAVLGPSGSGKSSVVLAGVLPALKRGDLPNSEKWLYLTIKPGTRPLDTLAAAFAKLQRGDLGTLVTLRQSFASDERALLLAADYLLAGQSHARLVLVVDQFEELWTQAPTELEARQAFSQQEQQPFIKQLLTAVQAPSTSLLVILTMRADFLHRAAEHRDLARLIGEHDVIVSPMQDEELRDAIIMPADKAGGRFEAGLVEELIAQTIGRQGALPLLEYTLLELWKSKNPDGTMTWHTFRQLGGVEGALAARADAILATYYTPAQQDELRHLLLRLIQPGEGAADTRRRALLNDLVPAGTESESVQLLLKPLVDERLLTTSRDAQTGEETVEVSHEALIRAWPTLSDWIDDAREDLRFHIQLEEAAKEWQTHEQNPDFLWSGLRLANAEEWLTRAQPRLNERDQRFLEASREAQEETAARQRRNTRLGIGALGLIAALIIAVLAVFALGQSQLAQQERETADTIAVSSTQEAISRQEAEEAARNEKEARVEAEQQTRIATARELASQSQAARVDYPQRRLLLAIEALQTTMRANEPRVPAAEQALRDALANSGGIGLSGHEGAILDVAISPDNHWLVTASKDSTARLWDLTAEDPAASSVVLTGHKWDILDVAFSANNHWLVTAGYGTTARLWDLTAKDPTANPIILPHSEEYPRVDAVAFSPNNHWLVTGGQEGTRLWDLTADNIAASSIFIRTGTIDDMAISPDNHWLVTASTSDAHLWDLTADNPAANPMVLIGGPEDWINVVALSPNNHWLVTGNRDGTARLWDLTTSDPAATVPIVLTGHERAIDAVAFSPNNDWLATGSHDGTARLWDLTTDNPTPIVLFHDSGVHTLAISPDNHWLVTGDDNGTARLWDLTADNIAATAIILPSHGDVINAIAISEDNHWLATGSGDATARLWDLTGNLFASPTVLVDQEKGTSKLTISSNEHWLVTRSSDGTARLWDLTANHPAATPILLTGHEEEIGAVVISEDNHWLVTRSENGTARLWDLTSNDPAATPILLTGHEEEISVVAISEDNHWLVTGSSDGTARLWDLTANDPAAGITILTGHNDSINRIAISEDNHWLVTGSSDRTARLWDLTANDPAVSSTVLTGHNDSINRIAISPDNRWLVTTASNDRTARLWDLTADNPAATPILLTGHEATIWAVISPDSHWLITGASNDRTARLWDLTADNPAATPILLTDIKWIAISSDSHWLVTIAHNDNTVRLWDLTADNPAATPILLRTGQEEEVKRFAISPDSRWLVTVTPKDNLTNADYIGHLWNLTADNIAANPIALAGHLDDIWDIEFSPNNRWLVTSSQDGTARLWDLTANDPSVSFIVLAEGGNVGSFVAISDHWLVIANRYRPTVRLWNLRLNELTESACRIAGRNLTEAEWSQYLGTQEYRKICPDLPVHYSVVNALKEEGRTLARAGYIDGALVKFQEALALGPTSELDPEVEAQQLAAQALVEGGRELARTGNLEGAVTTFQKALELDPSLELDPEKEAGQLVAQVLIREGETLAKAGEIEEAVAKFQEALELNPSLELEPQKEARRLAVRSLVLEGERLAREGKVEDAVAKFQEVLEVDPSQELDPETKAREVLASNIQDMIKRGQNLAKSGDIEGAIDMFQKALEVDQNLELEPEKEARKFAGWELYIKGGKLAKQGRIEEAIAAYSEAQNIFKPVPPLRIPASSWNTLCRYGSLWGYATDVMYACEHAVELAKEEEIGPHRDNRGLARALTGDYAGAIEDFEFYVEWSKENGQYEENGSQPETWIAELEAGRNPFDAETLEALRNE